MKFKKSCCYICLLTLSTGCSINHVSLEKIDSDPMNFRSYLNTVNPGFSNKGFYWTDIDSTKLMYSEFNSDKAVKLTYTGFIDDKPYDLMQESDMKPDQYSELYSGDNIIAYGEHIYYISERTTVEGKTSAAIVRVNKQGKNKEQVYSLDVEPAEFFIHQGKIYTYGMDINKPENSVLREIDIDKGILREFALDKGCFNFICNDDKIFYYYDAGSQYNIMSLDIKTFKTEVVAHGSLLNANGNYLSYYLLDNYSTDKDYDAEKSKLTCYLYDMQTKKVVTKLENEIIDYIDIEHNQYYTSQIRGTQVFKKYDFNHKVIAEIKPGTFIGSDGKGNSNPFGNLDILQILRVKNDELLSIANNIDQNVIKCSFKKEICVKMDE